MRTTVVVCEKRSAHERDGAHVVCKLSKLKQENHRVVEELREFSLKKYVIKVVFLCNFC